MGAIVKAEDIREGDYVIMRRKTQYVNKRQMSYKTRVVRIWDLRDEPWHGNHLDITGERNTPQGYFIYTNSQMWEYETLEPWEYFKIKKADWQKWINNQ
jgi:hypothetical protein